MPRAPTPAGSLVAARSPAVGTCCGGTRRSPGPHAAGWLDPGAIATWTARSDALAVDCLVPAGGVVVMRPLLLHASASSTVPGRRRVVHLEYAAEALPGGLEWYDPGRERRKGPAMTCGGASGLRG